MRSASLDPVLPAFDRAINDRGRLTVIEFEGEALRRCNLLPIETIGHQDHVPIVQISNKSSRCTVDIKKIHRVRADAGKLRPAQRTDRKSVV